MHERTTQVDSFYQIVVSAKIVGPEEAQEAQATAKKLGMSLSQAILILRHATEPTLRFAMDANELVKSDRINVDTAIAAVICARQNEFSIFQALDMMGIVLDKPPPPKVETNALTELMIEASNDYGGTEGELPFGAAGVDMLGAYYTARPTTIGAGTSEIQRNIMAKYVLKLPG